MHPLTEFNSRKGREGRDKHHFIDGKNRGSVR